MADAQGSAKRERESSTGSDKEWRGLGLEVTRLLLLAGTTGEPLALADDAHMKLVAHADTTRWLLLNPSPGGAADLPVPASPDDDPLGTSPDFALQRARREIARVGAIHRMAGRLFELYGAGVSVGLRGDTRWRSWERRRDEAVARSDEAVARVLAAASHLDTCRDVLVSAPFPVLTTPFEPYAHAVGQMARRARDEAADALAQARRMRDAAVLEFFDTWAVLILGR